MIKLFFLSQACLWLSLASPGYAQEVIASTGNHFQNNQMQISWTLGESVIKTVSNSSTQLTQGFQQSQLIVTDISENPLVNASILVYPNPTINQLHLKTDKLDNQKLHFSLFSMDGSLLLRKPMVSNLTEIQMSAYAPATYILRVSTANNTLKTFKIIKK